MNDGLNEFESFFVGTGDFERLTREEKEKLVRRLPAPRWGLAAWHPFVAVLILIGQYVAATKYPVASVLAVVIVPLALSVILRSLTHREDRNYWRWLMIRGLEKRGALSLDKMIRFRPEMDLYKRYHPTAFYFPLFGINIRYRVKACS